MYFICYIICLYVRVTLVSEKVDSDFFFLSFPSLHLLYYVFSAIGLYAWIRTHKLLVFKLLNAYSTILP